MKYTSPTACLDVSLASRNFLFDCPLDDALHPDFLSPCYNILRAGDRLEIRSMDFA